MLPPSHWSTLQSRRVTRPEPSVTIRRTRPEDAPALGSLAALDSARPLDGDGLIAEVDGTPVAAVELATGRAVADPFTPSGEVVGLLRLRAEQLGTTGAGRAHRRLARLARGGGVSVAGMPR